MTILDCIDLRLVRFLQANHLSHHSACWWFSLPWPANQATYIRLSSKELAWLDRTLESEEINTVFRATGLMASQ